MAYALTTEDEAQITTFVRAVLAALVIPAAGANVKVKADLAAAVAAADAAAVAAVWP
jgi:hypothetical protein